MPNPNAISADKLARLIGRPDAPTIVDVRTPEDFALDPRLVPGSVRRSYGGVTDWAEGIRGRPAVVVCHRGLKLSEGVAAWLRHEGVRAEVLEGGAAAWAAAGLPMVPDAVIPPRDPMGRTVWVTRARPKVDRIACPWLVRRFVDPDAVFLFVSPSEVMSVAEKFAATPFDVMVEEFGLAAEPLNRLARIVRGADTARPDLAPEAAGLLAASLGLSRMYADDLEQLQAGLLLYDAFYRWCRDASDETHNWPTNKVQSRREMEGAR